MWTMCEFHESRCNGFGYIWWTDNPIYFSSIIIIIIKVYFRPNTEDSEGSYSPSTSHDTCRHRDTDANVCLTNSENIYIDTSDIKKNY